MEMVIQRGNFVRYSMIHQSHGLVESLVGKGTVIYSTPTRLIVLDEDEMATTLILDRVMSTDNGFTSRRMNQDVIESIAVRVGSQ